MHLKPYGASAARQALAVAAVLAMIGHGAIAWSDQVQTRGKNAPPEIVSQADRTSRYASGDRAQFKGRQKPGFETFPPEERPRMQQQYREWQSLPPDQKDAMRRRMDEWNRMPTQERDRFQQRFQQWQQLSPDERRQMENNLRRWENLSPQERDAFRKRFRP
jgi:hypothetical protein